MMMWSLSTWMLLVTISALVFGSSPTVSSGFSKASSPVADEASMEALSSSHYPILSSILIDRLRLQQRQPRKPRQPHYGQKEGNENETQQQQQQQQPPRQLEVGDLDTVNNQVLANAEFSLPPMSMTQDSTTLSLTNIRCRQVQIGDVQFVPRLLVDGGDGDGDGGVDVSIQIVDLDLQCQANYDYDGRFFLSGRGIVTITSRNNNVSLDGSIRSSANSNSNSDGLIPPPTSIQLDACQPSVSVDNIDFDNGGLVGWILNLVEQLARGIMEDLVEDMLCGELQDFLLGAQGLLQTMATKLEPYQDLSSIEEDSLQAQQEMEGTVSASINLLDLQVPQTDFGEWVRSAVVQAGDYMGDVVALSDDEAALTGASTDLRANVWMRQYVLDDRALTVDVTPWLPSTTITTTGGTYDNDVLFHSHDVWMETTLRVQQVEILGLDTLYEFNPLEVVGAQTVQTRLAWEYLLVQVEATLELAPSTLENSNVASDGSGGITETVRVVFGLGDLQASLALLGALDQDLMESLRIGSLLEQNQLLPCLTSTLYRVALSTVLLEANDIFTPYLTGFESVGLDRLVDQVLQAAFWLYEPIVLQRSPAFFQLDARPQVNDQLRQALSEQSETMCPSPWTDIPSTPGTLVDFRDLLLPPLQAQARGGSGQEPYGNLVSSLVAPTLQDQLLLDADQFNDRFVRTATQAQSGIPGTLVLDGANMPLWEYQTTKPTALYNAMVAHVSNVRITNLDTVTEPLNVLDARDWNLLYNTLTWQSLATETPLTVTGSILIAIGDDSSPFAMTNHVDLSIQFPSLTMSLGILAGLQEADLLNFPLTDVMNVHCWLAALGSSSASRMGYATNPNQNATTRTTPKAPLDLETLQVFFSTFDLDATCLSCSSPGGAYLSRLLTDLQSFGFQEMFSNRILDLVQEVMWALWQDADVVTVLDAAPPHCPHRPEYNPNAAATSTADIAWPTLTSLSTPSWETILAMGMIGLQTMLVVAAKNFVLQETSFSLEQATLPPPLLVGDYSSSASIADFTNLSAEMGEWADFAFGELRKYLLVPIDVEVETNEQRILQQNEEGSPQQRPRLLTFLDEFLLDIEGAYTIALDSKVEALGMELQVSQVQILGLKSLINLDVLIPSQPQILTNRFDLEELTLVADASITVDGISKDVQFAFTARNISAQLDLYIAVDLNALREIQIGSIFAVDQIAACLASGLLEIRIENLSTTIESISDPNIQGFFSEDYVNSMDWVLGSMLDSYRADILEAAPLFLDNTFKDVVNIYLPELVSSIQQDCASPPAYTEDGLVDFRDLLMSPSIAESLGGSGGMPYGDLFVTLYDLLTENVLRTGASNRPVINDIFRHITKEQSNTTGTFFFEGDALDTQTSIKVAGLDANIAFRVSDFSLEHIDSVGDPLDLLRPLQGEANLMDNIVSFGVDAKPVRLAATIACSLTDGAEMNIRNELRVELSLQDVVIMAEILLKISEQSFAEFPIRDLNNVNCWLATVLSRISEDQLAFRGIELEEYSFSLGDFSLGLNCTSCTSPNFDELLLSLYDFSNATEFESLVRDQANSIFDTDFFPLLLDQIVDDSAQQCPHHPDYNPDALPASFLRSPGDSFAFVQMTASNKQPSYFNIVNGLIACMIFVFGFLARRIVKHRNQKWTESLSREGTILLERQQAKDREMQTMLDETTLSLFSSPSIPRRVRYGVPLGILLNIGLYMGGHLGTLSIVNIDASIAGESFTIYEFLEFKFFESAGNTFNNGGAEMAILLWIFTGIWPYIKLSLSLILWMIPPTKLCVKRRGQAFLWIDALAKLSVIDIFTMLLGFAVLLIFIGGPDEALDPSGEKLYAFKAIIIPKAGFYCLIVAQRISRVSSKFFLEYHEQLVVAATKAHQESPKLVAGDEASTILPEHIGSVSEEETSEDSVSNSQDDESKVQSLVDRVNEVAMRVYADEEVSSTASYCDRFDDVQSTDEQPIEKCYPENQREQASESSKEFRWGTLGVVFGGVTILIVFIIGCIFAPAISLDTSSVAGLAVESGMTYEDVVKDYGVFLVISSVLVQARFVLNTKADYFGFGLLMFAALVSIACVFFIQAYQFIKRKLNERKLGPVVPTYGHRGCGLPFYFRLYKWKHMEIYLISVAIGVWQLGSACAYAIHIYCDILRQAYSVMAYLGLVEESTAQCSRTQASLPGNLIIIGGSFVMLLAAFFFQAAAQYRKNIAEAVRWIDEDDVPRLSLAWSRDKSKNSRYSHLTASLSIDQLSHDFFPIAPPTPNTMASTPPGTPCSEARSGMIEQDTGELMPQPQGPNSYPMFQTPPRGSHHDMPPLSSSSSYSSIPPRRAPSVRFEPTRSDEDSTCSPPRPPRVHSQEISSMAGHNNEPTVAIAYRYTGDDYLL